jgi:hypothetical protein
MKHYIAEAHNDTFVHLAWAIIVYFQLVSRLVGRGAFADGVGRASEKWIKTSRSSKINILWFSICCRAALASSLSVYRSY